MVERPIVSVRMTGKEIAKACDAYYLCPKDEAGNRQGPLAGYASRDEQGRQMVGEVYVDFAQIEQWPYIVHQQIMPGLLSNVARTVGRSNGLVWCGMPEGGKTLAALLSDNSKGRYIYPEKVIEAADGVTKPKTRLAFGRHEITPGDDVIIVEDVTNGFSTTGESIELIESHGGKVRAIACFLNRSPTHRDCFPVNGRNVPVSAHWNEAMPLYSQDDPYVQDDVTKGRVVWEPKLNWSLMLGAQRSAKAA